MRAWVPTKFRVRIMFAVKSFPFSLAGSREFLLPLSKSDSGKHTREVMSPERPDLVLSAYIPNVEARVLVRDGLDVESDSGNGVDFARGARGELEGVKDGFGNKSVACKCLTWSAGGTRSNAPREYSCPYTGRTLLRRTGLSGCIKTQHQQAHFLAAEDLGQRTGECGAHCDRVSCGICECL